MEYSERTSILEIVKVLMKRSEGVKIAEICKEHQLSPATFHRWQTRYGYLAIEYAQLKKENEHLKHIYTNLFEKHEMLYEQVKNNI
ncbi:helix-turn-helix domain-containing protein [Pedobacter nototheniae]|uniref:helix-turn-helix domain-containing protein n=1 Tax=Pedobacter nototheniae TaxID=2488994 RepID=UPI00103D9006|nr:MULTISPECIES: helix-turn-helix domain-containing protein [Pedobacter]